MLARDSRTGVTLFELADGIDDGPVYGRSAFPIGERARISDLVAAAESATLELLDAHLPALARGEAEATAQDGEPSYGLQRRPEDGRVDWRLPVDEIDLLIRAVGRPYPGARAQFEEEDLVVWEAEPRRDGPVVLGAPGQIARLPGEDDPCVVTGDGVLVLRDVTGADGESRLDVLRGAANRRFTPYR
jgi:methionyl-tRNA formyltransferase